MGVCDHCGESFVPTHVNHRFCGKSCGRRYWRDRYRAEGKPNGAVVVSDCPWCGREMRKMASDARRRRRSFCSYLCRDGMRAFLDERNSSPWPKESARTRSRLDPSYLKRRCVALGIPIPLPSTQTPFYCGECRRCGAPFVSRSTSSVPRYCSERCVRADAAARRRARERDAMVAPVYRARVFAADGGRCHICGKKVRMDVAVPHPLAATLDHLIPLADGGSHEPRNVRLAHFICNSNKGNRLGGDQLILFGAA